MFQIMRTGGPGLPVASPEEAVQRSIKIDYLSLQAEKQNTIKKFTDIMQKK